MHQFIWLITVRGVAERGFAASALLTVFPSIPMNLSVFRPATQGTIIPMDTQTSPTSIHPARSYLKPHVCQSHSIHPPQPSPFSTPPTPTTHVYPFLFIIILLCKLFGWQCTTHGAVNEAPGCPICLHGRSHSALHKVARIWCMHIVWIPMHYLFAVLS